MKIDVYILFYEGMGLKICLRRQGQIISEVPFFNIETEINGPLKTNF